MKPFLTNAIRLGLVAAAAHALASCSKTSDGAKAITGSATYTIGVTVSGLTGTGLVLQDDGGANLAVSANGSFVFSTSLAPGTAYAVSVLTQPTGQTCTITNGAGTVGSANIVAPAAACVTSTLPLSSAKDMTGFSFVSTGNALTTASSGTISGTSIAVFLPPGTARTALKATFAVSANATVTVNGVSQTSGLTPVDFTNPVNFVVTAQDASQKTYVVTLTTDIAGIDQAVSAFMSKYSVPGLSLAITQNENLVYVKAYGKADDTKSATPQNLFRLASDSKQITSIAIMKLLDQGKIALSQKVFGAGAILGTTYGTQPYGPNITNITVDELLHHTSGGWPNDATDPMFTNPTMTAAQLITWTLDNRPLIYAPGTTYAYSNFGYCILGRVIEQITGMTYTAAVNALVLQPLGITDMAIAGNTLADRITNEVEYYGQSGENPYIYNISRMDSHGGWIATATDLARILVHVDGFPSKPDILSSSAITTMTTGSTANSGYACGWEVNSAGNWWHQGSLPGTATEQARTISSGRYNFVILTNTRSLDPNFTVDLDNLFWTALAATSAWPTYDLF